MDDGSKRRADREGNRIGNTVIDVDKLDRKAAEAEGRSRLFRKDLRIIQQILFFKLQFDKRRRQRQRIDRDIQFAHQIRHSSDVVFVPVREDQALDAVGICLEICKIRQNDIDTVHVLVRKSHTAVDDDDIAPELEYSHIFADLSEAAKRDNFQF